LLDVINKHRENEQFIYVCSENQQDNEICGWLKLQKCEYVLAFMYRTRSSDLKEVFEKNKYDLICFFTPSGVKSLFDNMPKFQQNGTIIGAFGSNTTKAVEEAGLRLEIIAPQPKAPSMITALDHFLVSRIKKK
jgi:uroporphyrinogen-III synthase